MKLKQLVLQNPYGSNAVVIPERMIWTSSSVKLWQKCKRKFFWKYLMRLRPHAKGAPLLIGSAFHNCLGEWYKGKRASMSRITSRYTRTLFDAVKTGGAIYNQDDLDKIQIAADTFDGMMKGYEAVYSDDRQKWTIERKSIEAKFRINLGPFDYAGKIDLVTGIPKSKGLFLVEHKTTSQIKEGYIDRLPLDTQIRGYVFGATHKDGLNLKVDHVLYDIVKKCKLKRKANETVDAMGERIALDYQARPEFYLYREPLLFDKEDLDSLLHELHQTHREFCHVLSDGDNPDNPRSWKPSDSACFDWFRTCEYHKLCTQGLDLGNARMFEQGEDLHEELAEDD